MEEKGTREVRARFTDFINRVAYGRESIFIVRRGKRIAALVPIDDVPPRRTSEERR